jgi:hypothetical protein
LRARLNALETENFEIREDNCRLKDEVERGLTEVELINRVLEDKERLIKELESYKTDEKCFRDMNTSALTWESCSTSTSTLNPQLIDMNCSAIPSVDTKDANTSAVDLKDEQISCDMCDKGVGNSFVELMDCQTSTHNLLQVSDKSTSFSIQFNTNSVSVETNIMLTEEKGTETDYLNETLRADKCIETDTRKSSDVCTSPMISTPKQTSSASTSPLHDLKENFVCKRDFEEVLRKLNAYEKEIKEKDAMIEFNRKIVVERDQSLNKLKEEVRKHELEFKPNVDLNLEHIFKHSIPLKTSSMASTIGSSVSTFTTKSVKSEDLNSISSMDSVVSEKPKKSAKYSTRKRKPNLNNSMDKRYLKSVDSNLDVRNI